MSVRHLVAAACFPALLVALAEPPGLHPALPWDSGGYEGKEFSPFFRQQRQQFAVENGPAVVRSLGLRPGMKVLDIGAGIGQYSTACAEALRVGGGSVLATEIDPNLVDFINREARLRGLTNLRAELVEPKGIDPRYLRHRYDLILVFHVAPQLSNRVRFFSELARRTEPGGRLVVLFKNRVPITPDSVIDPEGLLDDLASAGPKDPLASRLSASTRRLLAGRVRGEKASKDMVREVLDDIETTTGKLNFTSPLLTPGREPAPGISLTAEERRLFDWMILRVGRVLDEGEASPDEDGKRNVQILNTFLAARRLRPYLAPKRRSLGPGMRKLRRQLLEAGWKPAREKNWDEVLMQWEFSYNP